MARYTKTQVTQLSANEQAALNNINKNFEDLETAIQDTVSRSGNTPTHMTHDLDMNGKRIINVPAPTVDTDLVRRKDVVEDIQSVKLLVNSATNAASQALEAAQEVESVLEDSHLVIVADDLALGDNSKINKVANDIGDVSTVADNMTAINTVNTNSENIATAATNISNINTAATNISNINTCVTNMSAITDAPTQATAAAGSASSASNSATLAQKWANYTDGVVADSEYSAKKYAQDAAASASVYTTKANVDLDNLSAAGTALFTAKLDANKIQQVSVLPANPVADTLYLIPE